MRGNSNGQPPIGSWNPKNRPSSGGGGVTLLLLVASVAAYALYTAGDQLPECVAARVLLTGATVFAAKFECGLDALGMVMTQQRGLVGGGAANHATSSPAPERPAMMQSACPCTHGRYVGGDALDPRAYVWTWARDGQEHSLSERPADESDQDAIKQMREWGGSDPRKRQLAKNMLGAWGINPGQINW